MKSAILILCLAFGCASAQDVAPITSRVDDVGAVATMTMTEKLAIEQLNVRQLELNKRQEQLWAAQDRLNAEVAALASDVKLRIGAREIARKGDNWVRVR